MSPDIANPIAGRIARLRRKLRRAGVRRLLVTDPVDVGYLTGFTGDDSWLVAGEGRSWLLTDFRYAEQAERECPGVGLVVRRGTMVKALADLVRRKRIARLGYDPETMTVAQRSRLRRAFGDKVRLAPVAGAPAALRVHKDETEVRAIAAAVRVAEAAWREFRRRIRLGMTERELAADLDHRMRLAGADGPAFPTICAVDASSSMPHARPGDRRLRRGSVLLVDFGARVAGYVCDLTRVLFAVKMAPRAASIYSIVREAQAAAIARVGPGVPLTEVDAASRRVIEAAGFTGAFQHGTGHGLGRQVHEAPSLSPLAARGRLEPGMIVTIEPGIYLKGRFGIRLEDDVLVTETGRRVLTHLEKDLEAMVL